MNSSNKDEGNFFGGAVVYAYTRRQALADGVLVDITPLAREAGFCVPVVVTCGVWAQCVAVPAGVPGQDESGRLWDVLTVVRAAARAGGPGCDRVRCQVAVQNRPGAHDTVTLVAVCGPDEEGSPYVTIMLPEED
jgi:hypothetical protein